MIFIWWYSNFIQMIITKIKQYTINKSRIQKQSSKIFHITCFSFSSYSQSFVRQSFSQSFLQKYCKWDPRYTSLRSVLEPMIAYNIDSDFCIRFFTWSAAWLRFSYCWSRFRTLARRGIFFMCMIFVRKRGGLWVCWDFYIFYIVCRTSFVK